MAGDVVAKAAIFLSLVTFSIAGQFLDFADASRSVELFADTWERHLNKVWPASWAIKEFDQRWLESVMQNDSLLQSLNSTVNPQCFYDLTTWLNSLRKGEMWAIQSENEHYVIISFYHTLSGR